jgi:aryl-alcohol dehydrogenase-like predicted oxidoreductase
MRYRRLGSSGLMVSEIALGAGNFGKRVDQKTSTHTVGYALDHGITFIDTADWYGNGLSETFLGNSLKDKRHEVILATKFGSGVGEGPNDRGCSRYHILDALEKSLKRLRTDYIDLYQMHIPDPQTPLEETLRTLDDIVRAGKVRYLGLSNHAAWQVGEALWQARMLNSATMVSAQARYNLLDRRIEEELIPCCRRHGVGLLPWSALAGGFLTGKYRRGEAPPEGSRMTNPPAINARTLHDANFDKLARLESFCAAHGYPVGRLAVMWLLAKPWVSSVLSGPMRADQLDLYFSATETPLGTDEVAELDLITSWTAEDMDPLYLPFLRQENADAVT